MDFSTAIGASLAGLVASFTANLGPVVVVVVGIGAATMVWRRVVAAVNHAVGG